MRESTWAWRLGSIRSLVLSRTLESLRSCVSSIAFVEEILKFIFRFTRCCQDLPVPSAAAHPKSTRKYVIQHPQSPIFCQLLALQSHCSRDGKLEKAFITFRNGSSSFKVLFRSCRRTLRASLLRKLLLRIAAMNKNQHQLPTGQAKKPVPGSGPSANGYSPKYTPPQEPTVIPPPKVETKVEVPSVLETTSLTDLVARVEGKRRCKVEPEGLIKELI